MRDLATEFEKRIVNLDGIIGTSRAILTFTDGSRLEFELSSTQVEPAKATGGSHSYANQFASHVELFIMRIDAFEFTFVDDSRMAYDLRGSVVSFADQQVESNAVLAQKRPGVQSPSLKQPVPVFTFSMLILTLGMAWYYLQGPCGVNRVQSSTALLNAQHALFEKALSRESTVSPINLEILIMNLEKIQQDTARVEVPLCMVDAKTELEFSITKTLQAARATPADKKGIEVSSLTQDSIRHAYIYEEEVSEIHECKPFCQDEYPEGSPGESFVPNANKGS